MYKPNENRYDLMKYRNSGVSGLKLPLLSLGLWHNFGTESDAENNYNLITTAFDNGITHFDLANNYGPEPGSAEENFGKVLKHIGHRDEMVISTKAGYLMWPGPYGEFASKKYLIASLDQSLSRMDLDYVDIFYHHRPSDETPIEETAHALDTVVRQGKALYVGISNYPPEKTLKMAAELKRLGTPFIIHQPRYNLLDRWVEDGLDRAVQKCGIGMIAFSPLAQGRLTDRYLNGIPSDSRAHIGKFLTEKMVDDSLDKVKLLKAFAEERGQSLSQMAISYLLSKPYVTSVLIGASKTSQIMENLGALKNVEFSKAELDRLNTILK